VSVERRNLISSFMPAGLLHIDESRKKNKILDDDTDVTLVCFFYLNDDGGGNLYDFRPPTPHLLPYSTGQTEMKTVTQRLPPHPAVSLSYFNHHLNSYRVAWSSLEHLPSVDFDG
jgi:hypothetical protein